MRLASDFRQEARFALNGRWSLAVGTGFVAALLGGAGSGGSSGGGGGSSRYDYSNSGFDTDVVFHPIFIGFLTILIAWLLVCFFIGGAIQLGYCRFNMNLINNTDPKFKDLFSSFNIFWKAFGMQLLMGIYTFLWTLLFIIPGIIAAFSYAMTPYILEENPHMGINEAIRASKEMMRGNKWRLFCLEFSFIGWAILCVFTCGIGVLWLNPYIQASTAAFYKEVSGKNEGNSNIGYY